ASSSPRSACRRGTTASWRAADRRSSPGPSISFPEPPGSVFSRRCIRARTIALSLRWNRFPRRLVSLPHPPGRPFFIASEPRTAARTATSGTQRRDKGLRAARAPRGKTEDWEPRARPHPVPARDVALSPGLAAMTRPETAGFFCGRVAKRETRPMARIAPAGSAERLVEQRFGVFGLALACHQARQAFGRSDVAVQHVADVAGNRQFQAVTVGQAHDFVGGLHRFDHLADRKSGV